MLTYQLLEYSSEIVQALKEFSMSARMLFQYARWYTAHKSDISSFIIRESKHATTVVGGKSYNAYIGGNNQSLVSDFTENVNAFRKSVKLRELSKYLEVLENRIESYRTINEINDSIMDNLLTMAERTLDDYDTFLQSNNHSDAFAFSESANSFFIDFINALDYYESYHAMITPYEHHVTGVDNVKELEIQLLDVEFSFDDFIKNLNAINIMYNELKLVMQQNAPIPDLIVIKIESSSLLGKLLGADPIIEAIGLFLKRTINLIFDKFTKEGQIATNSQIRAQLRDDIELAEKLKACGYDISSTDETIQKTFAKITKETFRLASSSPKFKINGEELSYVNHKKQEYLNALQTLHITDRSEDTE